ncbi:MAG: pentapeptide repeat-containing protein, partial [Cyanobacteria bacterium J06636_27]
KAERAKLIGEEEALQNYIDKMSDLLIDKNLDELSDGNPLSNIIQARTTSIIRRLDENLELKRNIIIFLIDTKIIQKLKIDWSTTDLSHINLNDANLIAADFSGVNLTSAKLNSAKLLNVKLSRAKLLNAKLRRANLFIAILTSADLSGADLNGAYLTGAYLTGAYLTGAILSGSDLSNAILTSADLTGATLNRAKLIGTNLKDAIFWNKQSGKEAKKITPEQVKQATNWQEAVYSPEFRKKLGLPPEE